MQCRAKKYDYPPFFHRNEKFHILTVEMCYGSLLQKAVDKMKDASLMKEEEEDGGAAVSNKVL